MLFVNKVKSYLENQADSKISVALSFLGVFVIIFLFFARFEFNSQMPGFSGEDSFYHVGMAKYILANGIPHKFPYLFYTILNKNFVDHQLLFHLILIPFIKLFGDFAGPKLLTIIFVALSFSFLYLIFREVKLRFPLIFALTSFFILPADFYFRMAFIRVQAPALFLMTLLFYLILKKRPWLLGILSFLFVWLYGGFVFVPLLAVLYALSSILCKEKIELKIPIYILAGTILGVVINPFFPSNINFLTVQIFQTGLGAKPYSGGEWRPYDTWFWLTSSAVPVAVFFGALFIRTIKGIKANSREVLLIMFSFCLLILEWKSKRYVEYWPFWAVMTGILLVGPLLEEKIMRIKSEKASLSNAFFGISFLALVLASTYYGGAQINKARSDTFTPINLDAAKNAQDFLVQNSSQGDIVFTDDWDVFPYYFYFNQKDYYIVGLDPEFMNRYSHKLYEEFSAISSGRDSKNLQRIKTDFNAKWVIVGSDHSQFEMNLDDNPQYFEKVLANGSYTIYLVR